MTYPDAEIERLYQIWSKYHMATGYNGCQCEFHQGKWNTRTGITYSGKALKGTNGCLAVPGGPGGPIAISASGSQQYQGLAAWLPANSVAPGFLGLNREIQKINEAPAEARAKLTAKTGYNCVRCNFKNDYATANHGPDHYLCFNCR